MSASQNIMLELNKMGIELDMPPNKLKSGCGEGVCTVLYTLCDISMKAKFRYKKPVIHDDAAANDDDEGDIDNDELEGDADIGDMNNRLGDDASDGDDIDEDLDLMGAQATKMDGDEPLMQEIIQSNISREQWMIEVERVAHKLKINKIGSDGKEWRSHMDQTKKFHDQVRANLPEVRHKLERLSDEVSKALDKIGKKEQVLTRSF